jgi:hypothetical protein
LLLLAVVAAPYSVAVVFCVTLAAVYAIVSSHFAVIVHVPVALVIVTIA